MTEFGTVIVARVGVGADFVGVAVRGTGLGATVNVGVGAGGNEVVLIEVGVSVGEAVGAGGVHGSGPGPGRPPELSGMATPAKTARSSPTAIRMGEVVERPLKRIPVSLRNE